MAVALIAMPLSIRADQLLVIDTANDRILVCDMDSHQVHVFADIDAFDVAQATDGNLYASRTRSQEISKLDKAGKVLSDWTVPGNRSAYGLVYDNGAVWLLGICFVREAPERAIGSDRRVGKRGLRGKRGDWVELKR